jgi:hypothetical protein
MKLGYFALGLLTSLTIATYAIADDENGHGNGNGNGHGHGRSHEHHHDIKGTATFVAHIVLTPTDAAPGASGRLNIQSVNRNGTATGQIQIQTFGLNPGDYNVGATLASGDSANLGTITVRDIHSKGHGKGLSRTTDHWKLSDSLNAADITQVTVSDSNGTADLVGDFVNLARGSVISSRANVKLSGGDASPDASGSAQLSAVAIGTNVTGTVTVAANNLPTNTVLNVTANDQPVATTTTTKSGSTVLRNLRNASALDVNQVSLTTADGSTAATAGF